MMSPMITKRTLWNHSTATIKLSLCSCFNTWYKKDTCIIKWLICLFFPRILSYNGTIMHLQKFYFIYSLRRQFSPRFAVVLLMIILYICLLTFTHIMLCLFNPEHLLPMIFSLSTFFWIGSCWLLSCAVLCQTVFEPLVLYKFFLFLVFFMFLWFK